MAQWMSLDAHCLSQIGLVPDLTMVHVEEAEAATEMVSAWLRASKADMVASGCAYTLIHRVSEAIHGRKL